IEYGRLQNGPCLPSNEAHSVSPSSTAVNCVGERIDRYQKCRPRTLVAAAWNITNGGTPCRGRVSSTPGRSYPIMNRSEGHLLPSMRQNATLAAGPSENRLRGPESIKVKKFEIAAWRVSNPYSRLS